MYTSIMNFGSIPGRGKPKKNKKLVHNKSTLKGGWLLPGALAFVH